ncbi:hypothetical protein ACH5RR_032254 [Cinchona calisaya]|uniref:Uncharacterized protein n=1 Tax=Cinchona calisaya TaxID=153742 RepID=A0ABD2YKN3_9GENT
MEQKGITLETSDTKDCLADCRISLLDRDFGDRQVNLTSLKTTIQIAWNYPEGFKVIELGANSCQFLFSHEHDINQILATRSWFFGYSLKQGDSHHNYLMQNQYGLFLRASVDYRSNIVSGDCWKKGKVVTSIIDFNCDFIPIPMDSFLDKAKGLEHVFEDLSDFNLNPLSAKVEILLGMMDLMLQNIKDQDCKYILRLMLRRWRCPVLSGSSFIMKIFL